MNCYIALVWPFVCPIMIAIIIIIIIIVLQMLLLGRGDEDTYVQ